jgi:hypothetical protein
MSNRTVDFVGTTYSTRFGNTSASVSAPQRVCALDRCDADVEFDAASLPAMHALMNLGVSFSVYYGCPMLRAENVPSGAAADALVAQVALEFGSKAMRNFVQSTLSRDDVDQSAVCVVNVDDVSDDVDGDDVSRDVDGADAALVDDRPADDAIVAVVDCVCDVPT